MMRDPEARLQALASAFPVDWSQWFRGRDPDHTARAVLASLLADHRVGDLIDQKVSHVQRGLLKRYRDLLKLDAQASDLVASIDAMLDTSDDHPAETRRLIGRVINMAQFDADEIRALHHEALAAELWGRRTYSEAYQACLDTWATETITPDVPSEQDALAAAVETKLRATLGPGQADEPLQPFSGGFSKLTLRGRAGGRAIVVRADRLIEYAGVSVREEFKVIAAAHAAGIPVPRPFEIFAPEPGLHNGFILMEHVEGEPFGWLPEFPNRSLCRQLGAILADIHAVDLSTLATVRGSDVSTAEQTIADVARIEGSWRAAGCADPVVEYALQWLRRHCDWANGARGLVHGDYRPHNILRQGDTITAVLDWEHAKIGNPAEDLAYVREAVVSLWSWEEFLDAYTSRGGVPPDERGLRFYDVYAALFVLMILDQIEKSFSGAPGQPIFQIASVVQNRAVKLGRLVQLMDLPSALRSNQLEGQSLDAAKEAIPRVRDIAGQSNV
jgi:aminoglycoside phosphotransferase (APT) family kinase protein